MQNQNKRTKMATAGNDCRHRENSDDRVKVNNHSQQTFKNAREYAQALRPWLWWHQHTTAMQSYSMNMPFQMQNLLHLSNSSFGVTNPSCFWTGVLQGDHQRSSRPDPYASRRPPNFPNREDQSQNVAQNIQNQPNQQGQGNEGGVQMKIPTFWKRVAAELIDFTFLFYIKMIISISLVSEFNLDYLSYINREDILDGFSDIDYDRAFAITFEVIALEIINRVLITIFETMCLCRARARGRGMGATPGKRLMGLRVVSCDTIRPLDNGRVMVSPAGNISVKNAFLRSVIKNFTIAFFLPACLTLFFFKHNRTAYDVVAHTVVVEEVV